MVAPRRIGGFEGEYDIQIPGETKEEPLDSTLFEPRYIAASGLSAFRINSNAFWLPNGGSLHPDVKRSEYSGPEGDTAEVRAAFAQAGTELNRKLAATYPGARMYLHSGTTIGEDSATLGFHRSFMAPRPIANQRLPGLIDAHQATCVWAWGGAIGIHGFELSQKAAGLREEGLPTVYRMGNRRTTEGKKPMGWIKVGDGDVYPKRSSNDIPPWVRIENRIVDGIFSRWATWMSEATGSLVLRFAEHPEVFKKNDLPIDVLPLKNSVATLLGASKDLTFKQTYETVAGKNWTVLNMQEKIAEYGDYLRQRILLPSAEHQSIDELFDICNRLSRTNIYEGDVSPILKYIDFAPRALYLHKFFDLSEIKSSNLDAVERNLLWNRILPSGPGLKYWTNVYAKGLAPDPIGEKLLAEYLTNPCETTRSVVRSQAVQHAFYRRRLQALSWPYLSFLRGRTIWLDPYQNDPGVLSVIKK